MKHLDPKKRKTAKRKFSTAHQHKCKHACMCNLLEMPHCVGCHIVQAGVQFKAQIMEERWASPASS